MLCLSCLEESGKLVVQEMYSFNTILSLQLVFRNNGGEKRDLSQYTMRNLLLPLSFYLEAKRLPNYSVKLSFLNLGMHFKVQPVHMEYKS